MNAARNILISILLPLVLSACATAETGELSSSVPGLDYVIKGEGEYTVVFEAGFGTDRTIWEPVLSHLPSNVRTITYSRAGLGNSSMPDTVQTIEEHMTDLTGLLDQNGVSSNIILVGHSYGGLLAAEYSSAYPNKIIGLVLIDPATRHQRLVFKRTDAGSIQQDDETLLQVMPPNLQADYQALIEQMDAATGDVRPLPADTPTVLFTSTASFDEPFVFEETEVGRALWLQVHIDLFGAIRDGSHIRVPDAGHNIHTEQPELVAGAITDLVARIDRKNQ